MGRGGHSGIEFSLYLQLIGSRPLISESVLDAQVDPTISTRIRTTERYRSVTIALMAILV